MCAHRQPVRKASATVGLSCRYDVVVPQAEGEKAPLEQNVTEKWDGNFATDFSGFSGGVFSPEDQSQ
jgi:phosphate-selective porin